MKISRWLFLLLLVLPGSSQEVDRQALTRFAACKSNLRVIFVALESYYAEKQQYPERLADLGVYLSPLPVCPAAGADTYSPTYQAHSKPDRFTIACGGHHHGAAFQKPNHPAYDFDKGVIEDPAPK